MNKDEQLARVSAKSFIAAMVHDETPVDITKILQAIIGKGIILLHEADPSNTVALCLHILQQKAIEDRDKQLKVLATLVAFALTVERDNIADTGDLMELVRHCYKRTCEIANIMGIAGELNHPGSETVQ